MSRLDELIQELCPDGVEYKRLNDACTINRGIRVVRSQLKAVGQFPVFQNSLVPMGYHDRSNCPANTAFVIVAGAAGDVGYSKTEFWAADDCFYFTCPETLLSRYLYYVLMSQQTYLYSRVRKASIPRLARNFIEDLKIPVPPLPVQSEIVKILDNFTELTAQLQEQLTLELSARKRQYEYYRDKLLTFDVLGEGASECVWRTLGDFCDLLTGYPFDSSQFKEDGVRLLRGMNIKRGMLKFNAEINKYWVDSVGLERFLLNQGDIVIAMDGSLVGKSYGTITESDLPLLLVQRVTRIRTSKANIRYVYHYIASGTFTSYVEKKKSPGAIPHISLKDISNFAVPLPPLPVQERLVEILDRFDALCNDLTSGLPAEIAARQKQYGYYRDKLLTFKERA